MKERIEWVTIPAGYHCPLCPDHIDDCFGRQLLLPAPLCDGCLIELDHYALTRYPALPREWMSKATLLEELAGQSWRELRAVIIQDQLDSWSALQGEKSGRWLDTMLAQGWSRERCDEHIDQQVSQLSAARADAECEREVQRLLG